MRYILIFILSVTATISFTKASIADAEYVYVHQVLDDEDKGIIVRRNGEAYIIEKGVGCLSFWRYEGKVAVVNSPGLFAGVGSYLVLPDHDQDCRIWNAEPIQ